MNPQAPLALLGGLAPAAFMRRHWHKRPLLVRAGWPGVVPPLDRAALFALAARDDVESRLVVDDGARWTLRRGPFASRRALPALKRPGWTLLVQGLDLHVDAAHALLAPFRFVPAARLDDVMVSYASDGGGVGPHLDSYDVFLLQVQGRRRWRWGRAAAPPAWRDDTPLKILRDFVPQHDAVLEPGDLLYLPPGWGHDGTAVGGDCMTCSIGFRAPSRGELLRELLARIAEDGDAGDDTRLYRDPAQPATAQPGLVPAPLQDWAADAVQRALRDRAAVAEALGCWLTEPKPQVWFEAAADDGALVRGRGLALDRRSRMMYDRDRIYLNGESWRASGADARLLRRLADERRLDARDWQRASSDVRRELAAWAQAGWLHAEKEQETR